MPELINGLYGHELVCIGFEAAGIEQLLIMGQRSLVHKVVLIKLNQDQKLALVAGFSPHFLAVLADPSAAGEKSDQPFICPL